MEKEYDDHTRRVKLYKASLRLNLLKKIEKEMDNFFITYLQTHMVKDKTVILPREGADRAFFITLDPSYNPFYKKNRYLGDISWGVKYLDPPGDPERYVEITISMGTTLPRRYHTFRIILKLEECVIEYPSKIKWLGPKYTIVMVHIMSQIQKDAQIFEYINFIINEYKTRGDNEHEYYHWTYQGCLYRTKIF